MDDVVRRVASLEKGLEKLDGKIDKLTELVNAFGLKTSERLGGIEGRLTGIEKTLESKASSADVKLVEGKVSSIPTTWQVVGLMGALVVGTLGGVAGLAFALARYLKP